MRRRRRLYTCIWYVCICMCIYIYIYIHMHTYMYLIYIYIYIYIYINTSGRTIPRNCSKQYCARRRSAYSAMQRKASCSSPCFVRYRIFPSGFFSGGGCLFRCFGQLYAKHVRLRKRCNDSEGSDTPDCKLQLCARSEGQPCRSKRRECMNHRTLYFEFECKL